MSQTSATESLASSDGLASTVDWIEALISKGLTSQISELPQRFPNIGSFVKPILQSAAKAKHTVDENSGKPGDHCAHTEVLNYLKVHHPEKYKEAISTTKENDEWTLAHCAVESDCEILLSYLKSEGCFLDEAHDNVTPLSFAITQRLLKSLRYLLESGWCNLNHRDEFRRSYLMLACQEQSLEAVRLLSEKYGQRLGEELLEDCCENGDSCVQATSRVQSNCSLAEDCKHVQIFEFIKSQVTPEQFAKVVQFKDESNCSLIQKATVGSNCVFLLDYLHVRCQLKLDEPDNDGDTALGYAALYGHVESTKYFVEHGSDLKHRNKHGETHFLQACRGLKSNTAIYLATEAKADIFAKDNCDNTALHLMCGAKNLAKDFGEFSAILHLRLTNSGNTLLDQWQNTMQLENVLGHNIMMVLADTGNLKRFITDPELRFPPDSDVSGLLRNSDGLNVLHFYAAKYSLKQLHSESFFAEYWEKLVTETVRSGYYKGYGCLHFACQMGHLENINYMLLNYPNIMKERTKDECPSPIDVLMKHRHEDLLTELKAVTVQQLIESADNVETALRLPSVDDAKRTLVPLCDPELKEVVLKPRLRHNEQHVSGRAVISGQGDASFPYGVRLFHIALREDSAEIFRCIIALGFWSYLKTQKAAQDYNGYILHLIETERIKTGNARIGARDVLPCLQIGFRDNLQRQWQKTDNSSICFDLPFPSLLGIAIKSGRVNIAKDLILLEQYNLVPTCLMVIEECKFLVDDKALQESIADLRSFAVNVALNAMDELDKSADHAKLALLHRYLGGRFKMKCLVSTNESQNGPKFICFGQSLGESSVMKCTALHLLVETECYEVMSCRGFTHFTDNEWKEMGDTNAFKAPPMVKFCFHLTSFLVFLGFFSYFACYLRKNLQWIDVVMLCFAVSIALNEAIDFFQVVTRRRLRSYSRSRSIIENLRDYAKDGWNYLDNGGTIILLIGLFWKFHENIYSTEDTVRSYNYFCIRMLLSTAHLFWSVRFISFLQGTKLIGPSISMMNTLLKRDLLPFLIVLLTLCFSFGMFYVNLLNPDTRTYSTSGAVGPKDYMHLTSIYLRPLLTVFGALDVSDLTSCENLHADWSDFNSTEIPSDATCTHPVGTFHYRKYLLLPFLFLINLTMLNLLIAKFSLTVSREDEKAFMIFRQLNVGLLMDFKRAPTLPPPLTIFWLTFVCLRRLCNKITCRNHTGCTPQSNCNSIKCKDPVPWWPTEPEEIFQKSWEENSDELEDFLTFNLFQAKVFREKRRRFAKPRMDHGSGFDKLKVDIQNMVSESEFGVGRDVR